MLTIIKRSGKKEPFDIQKVSSSIAAASDDAKQPLNESDLRRIIAELQHIIAGKELITSQQVIIITTGLLYTKGYFAVLDHYLSYSRKRIDN